MVQEAAKTFGMSSAFVGFIIAGACDALDPDVAASAHAVHENCRQE
jgi:hypothetical protein